MSIKSSNKSRKNIGKIGNNIEQDDDQDTYVYPIQDRGDSQKKEMLEKKSLLKEQCKKIISRRIGRGNEVNCIQ